MLSPIYGTPAYRGGVLAGDHILEIDGRSTDGIDLDEAADMVHGEEAPQVTLTVLHPGKRERTKIKLVRQTDSPRNRLGRSPQSGRALAVHARSETGRRLRAADRLQFRDGQRVAKAFSAQLQKEKLRGLIHSFSASIPAASSTAGIEVSDLFVSEGRIVSTKGRNSPEHVWDAHKEGTFSGFPLVVLVNRFSASSAESSPLPAGSVLS